ncbi:MAG: flagellar hook-length control protein FliK [Alphaproteobacteria bacterium]|nr:flagellar hook-length control protein FliK [Alphaproteobacteria bacterium]
MSSLVAHFLTGIAPAPASASGAAGVSASAPQDGAEFEALIASGSAPPVQRPANTQIGRAPAHPNAAAPEQAVDQDALQRAARLGLDEAATDAPQQTDAPMAAAARMPAQPPSEAGPETLVEIADSGLQPDVSAPGSSQAALSIFRGKAASDTAQVRPSAIAQGAVSRSWDDGVKAPVAKQAARSTKDESPLNDAKVGGTPAVSGAGPQAGAQPLAVIGQAAAASPNADAAAPIGGKQAAVAVQPGPTSATGEPAAASPGAPSVDTARLDGAKASISAKASGGDLAAPAAKSVLEALPRDARGVSEIAAARAPGEQVKAAARLDQTESGAGKTDLSAGKSAPAPGAEAVASKPAAPAPSNSAATFASAMLNAASAKPLLATLDLAGSAGLTSEAEADLSLEASGHRSEARAEVQRQAMPQAANAHAAARFQPQTVQMLAARIAARAVEGGRVFDIRLDPAELGRVEVRLEMGADNSVRALLSAERADTLADLQRSARDLEKALAEAGLDLAEDGLSFSLNDDGAPSRDDGAEPRFTSAAWSQTETVLAETADSAGPLRLYGFEIAARRGLDVRT